MALASNHRIPQKQKFHVEQWHSLTVQSQTLSEIEKAHFIRSPISHKGNALLVDKSQGFDGHGNEIVTCFDGGVLCVLVKRAARSAAAPGVTDVRARWEAANVSGQVTSQVRHLPTLQGTSVIPSGRLSSDLNRPIGSRDEGTWIGRRLGTECHSEPYRGAVLPKAGNDRVFAFFVETGGARAMVEVPLDRWRFIGNADLSYVSLT